MSSHYVTCTHPMEQTCLVVEVDQETEIEGRGDTPKTNATRNRVEDGAKARSGKENKKNRADCKARAGEEDKND